MAASISISIDSLRSWRPRADSPTDDAGGRPRSASFGTHAKPNAGRSTTAQTPSIGELGGPQRAVGTQVEGRVGQDHRRSARHVERVDHEVAGAGGARRSGRGPSVPTIPRARAARPDRFDSGQRGRGLVVTAGLDQVFDFLERGQTRADRRPRVTAPAADDAIARASAWTARAASNRARSRW